MITREMMIATIEALGADATLRNTKDYCLDVTIEDFEGFDDDYDEIMRDYDNAEAVECFEEMLETECLSQEGDFYITYHFEGFDVCLGYASFDI
jgi:hypothetical protein